MNEAKWQAAEKAPFIGPPALNGQKFKPLIGFAKVPLSFVVACLHVRCLFHVVWCWVCVLSLVFGLMGKCERSFFFYLFHFYFDNHKSRWFYFVLVYSVSKFS